MQVSQLSSQPEESPVQVPGTPDTESSKPGAQTPQRVPEESAQFKQEGWHAEISQDSPSQA